MANSYLDLDNSAFRIYSLEKYRVKPLWYDTATARLISLITAFESDIVNTRNELSIKQIVELPINNFNGYEYDEDGLQPLHVFLLLENYFETVAKEQNSESITIRNIFEEKVGNLLEKYKLPYRWKFPVLVLLITDVLVLPLNKPIYIKPPKTDSVASIIRVASDRISSRYIEQDKFLSIVVTEKMSITELIMHLKSDIFLELELQKLPDFRKPKIKNNALYWGHLAWAIKTFEDKNSSWQQIVDRLFELKPDKDVPDRASIAVYYSRFMQAKSIYDNTN